MVNGVSYGSPAVALVARKNSNTTKTVAGAVATTALVAGGLALGHKSGAFSKGAGKLIVNMRDILETARNTGNVTAFKKLKFKSLAASVKGLGALNKAGKYVAVKSEVAAKFVADKSAFAAKYVAVKSKVVASFVMDNAKKAFSAAKGLLKKASVFVPKA